MNAKTIAVETDTGERKEDSKTEGRRPERAQSPTWSIKPGAWRTAANEGRVAGHIDLMPQFADVDVDQVRLRHIAIMPNVLQEHCTGNDLAGTAHEIFQKLELGWQQIENALTTHGAAFDQIYRQWPRLQDSGA